MSHSGQHHNNQLKIKIKISIEKKISNYEKTRTGPCCRIAQVETKISNWEKIQTGLCCQTPQVQGI